MTIPVEIVKGKIYLIRGQKVLLDVDLAELYGVDVKVLNQAVKRNSHRFPQDFMFQLDATESAGLRSQIVTLKSGRGGHRKYLPYVFTEQGVAMLSSVLKSDRAVQVNIAIMRAFVQMRELAASNRELAGKFAELEQRVGKHDDAIRALFDAIGELMTPVASKRRKIGFGQKGEE
jgi:hypothetical protein